MYNQVSACNDNFMSLSECLHSDPNGVGLQLTCWLCSDRKRKRQESASAPAPVHGDLACMTHTDVKHVKECEMERLQITAGANVASKEGEEQLNGASCRAG